MNIILPILLAVNPYISQVYDYCPAPGQFINEMPEWEQGMTRDDIIGRAAENICGTAEDPCPGMISLGSFGGYVVFGFDHPVVNVEGAYDFKIYGNSYCATGQTSSGSSEPGIVMVSMDTNGNGLPDDEWYELWGSAHADPLTIHDFTITYRRPLDAYSDILWTSDSDIRPSGRVGRNSFHSQNYWPEWVDCDSLVFTGTCLPDNAHDVNGNGTYILMDFFDWGYADNRPNADDPGFDISWAVDSEGAPVSLPHVDFIKVYTATCQTECGRLGEVSTEITGGEDLHPEAVSSVTSVEPDGDDVMEVWSISGVRMQPGKKLPAGIWIIRTPAGCRKLLVN